MYRIDDSGSAISEIQRYLRMSADRIYANIDPVSIDGIYGSETREAVVQYQEIANLEKSGVVNYITFTKLFKSYQNAQFLQSADRFLISKRNFPFKQGDHGNEVLIINIMLDELKNIYRTIHEVKLMEYYSGNTSRAVRNIREIFRMEASPNVDVTLYERMSYELTLRAPLNFS